MDKIQSFFATEFFVQEKYDFVWVLRRTRHHRAVLIKSSHFHLEMAHYHEFIQYESCRHPLIFQVTF